MARYGLKTTTELRLIHLEEVRVVDFLNGYKVVLAYADNTRDDFFDTLSDYISCVAAIGIYPQDRDADIEYVVVALNRFSVIVRVKEIDPSKETRFREFLGMLALKSDIFIDGDYVSLVLAKVEKRFKVQLLNQRRDEHRRMLPFNNDIEDYDNVQSAVNNMISFIRDNNSFFDRLCALPYDKIRPSDDSAVDYEFLVWSQFRVSIWCMIMSKFYGLGDCREELKNQETENGLEINADDLVMLRGIAKGGYGTVNAYYHVKYHQVFAVKQPLSAAYIQKLRTEYTHLRRFSKHPSIIHAFAWVESVGPDKRPGIVQEYALYGTADSFYYRKKHTKYLVFIYLDMFFAMRFMHSMGYVHRDFKMENVLMDAHCHAKLADFSSCCTYEEAHLNLKGNVTMGRWERETANDDPEFTFHTDIGMMTREIFNTKAGIKDDIGADPLVHNIPGFDVQSLRSSLTNFVNILSYGFLLCPDYVQSRLFTHTKIQELVPREQRKNCLVVMKCTDDLFVKFVRGQHLDFELGKALTLLQESWYEYLDTTLLRVDGSITRNYTNACSLMLMLFSDAMWITKKWGDDGSRIRCMIREIFERTNFEGADSSHASIITRMSKYLTYVFQFCDEQERNACMPLLKLGFKLAKLINSADMGVCLGIELFKQQKCREGEKVLVEAIAEGKKGRHSLTRSESECWLLETGIWELAKWRLDRSSLIFNESKDQITCSVNEAWTTLARGGRVDDVVRMFEDRPELLIWTLLLVEMDLDTPSHNYIVHLVDFEPLCSLAVVFVKTRPMRSMVTLIRWIRRARNAAKIESESHIEKKIQRKLMKFCQLADRLADETWPVISIEMYTELIWMKEQALKHCLI